MSAADHETLEVAADAAAIRAQWTGSSGVPFPDAVPASSQGKISRWATNPFPQAIRTMTIFAQNFGVASAPARKKPMPLITRSAIAPVTIADAV